MAKNLLIVESPNKRQKLTQILESVYGPGQWVVAASVGHVQDLPDKTLGINRESNYSMTYQVSENKQTIVSNLQKLSREVGPQNVVLATDPDREGEAIAWHLTRLLGISPANPQRATFQEITKTAIVAALNARRPINMNLVKAQEARRCIDRLSGYEISDVIRRKTGKNLTAGRVQSVALKLVVEQEKIISAFNDQFTYKLTASFLSPKGETVKANYAGSAELNALSPIKAYLETATAKEWRLLDSQTKPVVQQPGAAFTTSSLQQEAIRKLSWPAIRVMDVAQSLFANGHITYMRTDSPNLSDEAVEAIEQQVKSQFGANYFQARRFPVKADAQEAHEAIRPTHMENPQAGTTPDEQALYRLIYTRAMASQMQPALFDETTLLIGTGQEVDHFQAKAKVLRFEGYRAIYQDAEEEAGPEAETVISPIAVGSPLTLHQMQGRQTYRQPPKRFDEANLVKNMEKNGIGRPSTYANILANIQKRGYVETGNVLARKLPATIILLKNKQISTSTEQQSIGGDKAKLIPTDTGLQLGNFLTTNFGSLVDYGFTSGMEKQLDQIVEGTSKFLSVIQQYDQMHLKMIRGVETSIADTEQKRATRLLGNLNNLPVRVGTSAKGTYLIHNDKFTSVDNPADEVTLDMAIAYIQAAPTTQPTTPIRLIHQAGKYEIKHGKFGYFLTDGTTNASLPPKYSTENQVKTIKAADAKEIMENYIKWKKKKQN